MEKKNRIQELEEKSASPTVSSSLRCPRRVAVRPLLPRANGVSMKLTEIIKHQHKKLIDFHRAADVLKAGADSLLPK